MCGFVRTNQKYRKNAVRFLDNFAKNHTMDKATWCINGHLFDIQFPCIMGILNITPDSFYSESRIQSSDDLLRKAEQMLTDGALILDLGAISTRPGSKAPTIQEELERLLPALKTIRKHFPDALISVDTFRSEVARAVALEGANIINDISGGTLDPSMFQTVAQLRLPYVLMHIKGTPETMQQNPEYDDVVIEVNYFFSKQLHKAHQAGIHDIIIDPGFGFGKTLEHNYQLLKHLKVFQMHNKPIMVGISRKSMIYKLLQTTPEDALFGTIASHTIALLNEAQLLRVHDVKAASHVITIVQKYLSTP